MFNAVILCNSSNLFFTNRRRFVKYDFMIKRPFWRERIEASWEKAPIVWLAGVQRVGKTILVKSL